ncbi:PEP-CTERM sorting domain-containing protein [Aliivibrio kagoshimensis]|uniref:PEP-CTERM sorting domain-containing protein n=1 Tax=Aliivibrio kagoshimensis TaxID=2910230 RepID=UPI003D0EBCED
MKQFTALIFAVFFTFSTNALEIKGEFSGAVNTFFPSSFEVGEMVTGNISINLDNAPIPQVGFGKISMTSRTINWIDMSINVGKELFDFSLDPTEYFSDSITLNNPMIPSLEESIVIEAAGGEFFKDMERASLVLTNWSDYLFGPNGMTCTSDCGVGGLMKGKFASFNINNFTIGPVNPIPEPSTLLMFAFGVLGLTRLRKQR